jgi:hypothetical protein
VTAYVVTGWPAKWLVGAIFIAAFLLWLWLTLRFLDLVDRFVIQPLIRRSIQRALARLEEAEEES